MCYIVSSFMHCDLDILYTLSHFILTKPRAEVLLTLPPSARLHNLAKAHSYQAAYTRSLCPDPGTRLLGLGSTDEISQDTEGQVVGRTTRMRENLSSAIHQPRGRKRNPPKPPFPHL